MNARLDGSFLTTVFPKYKPWCCYGSWKLGHISAWGKLPNVCGASQNKYQRIRKFKHLNHKTERSIILNLGNMIQIHFTESFILRISQHQIITRPTLPDQHILPNKTAVEKIKTLQSVNFEMYKMYCKHLSIN